MFTTFYNETIRKTVVAFGSLFDEIFVVRKDSDGNVSKRIMVPISYAAKEKFIRMFNEFPLTKVKLILLGSQASYREWVLT